MKKIKQPRGLENIRTVLSGERSIGDERVIAMRKLVKLETHRNRLSRELQTCLQKQQSLQEQIEDLTLEIDKLQEVVIDDEVGDTSDSVPPRFSQETWPEQKKTTREKKQFIIEY